MFQLRHRVTMNKKQDPYAAYERITSELKIQTD